MSRPADTGATVYELARPVVCARNTGNNDSPCEQQPAPGEVTAVPFGEYDSFEACTTEHSDKDDPDAYCAEIHYQITGEYPGDQKAQDIFDSAGQYARVSLQAMKAVGKEITDERLAAVSTKASLLMGPEDEKQDDPQAVCGDLWFHEYDTYADSFGNGGEGRGPDERPPESWWNDCVATIADSGREAIDTEGAE